MPPDYDRFSVARNFCSLLSGKVISRLVALPKPPKEEGQEGGVRPVAVGEAILRVPVALVPGRVVNAKPPRCGVCRSSRI